MTATQSKAGRGGALKYDAWFGVLDDRGKCRHCGHYARKHNVEAQMVRLKGRRRRERVGVKFMACIICAGDMVTKQVMCYQFTTDTIKAGQKLGIVFC